MCDNRNKSSAFIRQLIQGKEKIISMENSQYAQFLFFNFLHSPGHRSSVFLITQIFILCLVRVSVSLSAITCACKAAIITGKMIKNVLKQTF